MESVDVTLTYAGDAQDQIPAIEIDHLTDEAIEFITAWLDRYAERPIRRADS